LAKSSSAAMVGKPIVIKPMLMLLANAIPARVVITKTVLHIESSEEGAAVEIVSKEMVSEAATGSCSSKGNTLLIRSSLPAVAEDPLLGALPIDVDPSLRSWATLNSRVLSTVVVAISKVRKLGSMPCHGKNIPTSSLNVHKQNYVGVF
jgi:hypothetical protein